MKRLDAMDNESRIRSAVLSLMKNNKSVPSIREISNKVNLSVPTVTRHIKQLWGDLDHVLLPSKTISREITSSLINNALAGCHKSIKLYYQLIYNFRENSFSEEGVVESTPIRINTNPKKSKEAKIDDTKLIE